jgi:hypothetical protein
MNYDLQDRDVWRPTRPTEARALAGGSSQRDHLGIRHRITPRSPNTYEAERLPTSLGSFKHFQTRLKESLEAPPKFEAFELVSVAPIF